MATKVVRGQLMTFIAEPTDYLGAPVTPDSLTLYLNYVHANGTTSTDEVEMELQTGGGTWQAEFDTSVVGAQGGPLFVSLQAEGPSAAQDEKFTIVANNANPAP